MIPRLNRRSFVAAAPAATAEASGLCRGGAEDAPLEPKLDIHVHLFGIGDGRDCNGRKPPVADAAYSPRPSNSSFRRSMQHSDQSRCFEEIAFSGRK
jgi:hypothetical protein